MGNKGINRIGTALLRLILRIGFISGEKGKTGKGILARSNKSGIAKFSYRFDGTIGGNNFVYTVAEKDGAAVFACESMRRRDVGKAEMPVDKNVLERLYKAYLDLRLAAWNGYSRYNSRIHDGRGFSLSIRFRDGKELSASGMNAFPARYGEFCERMGEILDPLKDKLLK